MSGMLKKVVSAQASIWRAFLCLGLQGCRAPLLWSSHLHSRVLRTIESGAQVINSTKDKKERIGKIFQMHANKENPVEKVSAGTFMPSLV